MNTSFKKTLSVVVLGAMVLSLAACSSTKPTSSTSAPATSATSSSQKITLEVWHQWSDDSNALKKDYNLAVTQYESSHPNITINTDALATDAYKTKLKTAFASNEANVDVFYDWSPGSTQSLAQAGKLLPIDSYVKDGTLDKVVPGSLTAFQMGGKLYSLPMFSWYMVLYANKDLFAQAGAKEPTTFDELITACKQLSAKGILPITNGSKDAWNACFVYEALAMREEGAANVVNYLNGTNKMTDAGYTDAAAKVQQLVSAGAFGNSTLATASGDADTAFTTGKAAMRLMGSWFAGNVYAAGSTVEGKVDALAIPLITGGKGDATNLCGGFTESFLVNNNTKYPAQAVDFMKYINETMGKYVAENSMGFDGWKDTVDESGWNPVFKQINDITSKGTSTVLAWDTFLDGAMAQNHYDDVQALFGNKITPANFVKAENASWNS
jgi:raffinose/stachyose/melibiose transport system substrate-binding protein